jgi:hypothetical protein
MSIQAVYNWSLRAPWRTWVAHTALGLLLAPVFGAWTVMIFYLLREIEQMGLEIWTHGMTVFHRNASDHFIDLAAPFFALLLTVIFLGW